MQHRTGMKQATTLCIHGPISHSPRLVNARARSNLSRLIVQCQVSQSATARSGPTALAARPMPTT